MARTANSKCKLCRRAGEKLFLRGERCFSPKCAMVKRNYPPGQHGPKGYQRLSGFGQQLKEKQKAKRIYGLPERQLHKYFVEAFRHKGNTAEMLYQIVECRLDNVIYNLGLAKSCAAARQLVSHGHFTVNGKKVDIPSYIVKNGQIIKVKEQSNKRKYFTEIVKDFKKDKIPEWLALDTTKTEGKVIAKPSLGGKQAINWQAIVEFYSR